MKTDKARDLKIWHITNMPSEAGTQFISKIAHDQAVKQLEQRLNEAEKVIAFYANLTNWEDEKGEVRDIYGLILQNDLSVEARNEHGSMLFGGKLARQYMEKMK